MGYPNDGKRQFFCSAHLLECRVDKPKQELTIHRAEFVGLIAMMFASIAFSIDAMLPALPEISRELSPELAHRAPLILTAFVFGMGAGTLVTGALSDAFGRRPVIFGGVVLYIIGAMAAWASQSLEAMLVARVFQGLGAAGPRVVAIAVVRDLFSGRDMAKIVSFIMLVFTLVPALAPIMGSLIIELSDWRGIYLAFVAFSAISVIWMAIRLPETLRTEDRRPLRLRLLLDAIREIMTHRTVRLAIIVQVMAMAMFFCTLMLIQPVYAQVYGRAETFPYWFGAVAVIAGTSSILNALLVERLGMRRLVRLTLFGQILLSGFMYFSGLASAGGVLGFGAFLFWQLCLFAQVGLTLGNLNAIAMEPMGHMAGMAASVIGSISTILAALIASPVALMFADDVSLLFGSVLLMACAAWGLMLMLTRTEADLAAPAE